MLTQARFATQSATHFDLELTGNSRAACGRRGNLPSVTAGDNTRRRPRHRAGQRADDRGDPDRRRRASFAPTKEVLVPAACGEHVNIRAMEKAPWIENASTSPSGLPDAGEAPAMRFIWARTNPLQGTIHQFQQQSQARQSHPLMPKRIACMLMR